MVDPDWPQMTNICRMQFSCGINKATNTHSEYVTILLFHRNNGCTNASECYVILTFHVSLFERFRKIMKNFRNYRSHRSKVKLRNPSGTIEVTEPTLNYKKSTHCKATLNYEKLQEL
jgi:hypothetical protein